jgi:hypothetical protein
MPDIFHQLDEMNLDELKQVMAYIQQRQITVTKISIPESKDEQPSKRTPGLTPGIWMSDDFDEELPDSFWLGEETE